ncbi:MAG: ADP-ribosylglycohydrolase family protein [Pirellulales bacterium]|nr:ADP-ribosylglycohydrolase family protein [Pirellulales bacterium]
MKTSFAPIGSVLLSLTALALVCRASEPQFRRLPVEEYRDKMTAGWIGQIAGVSLGDPTEFKYAGKIIPEEKMPKWEPKLINRAFKQDDLYVEMTFLRSLEQYGLEVGIRQAGIDFANSRYNLWCANNAGRTNLRDGIAPPDSSHPRFNQCPNDIDYQIEADFSGLIAPGLPNASIELGDKFGRLMNYGEGVYAGQFVGALYGRAFFESDPVKLVEYALKAIPAESRYAQVIRDVLAWHREDPNDWQKTWNRCEEKFCKDNYRGLPVTNGGIDCRINGAYVVIGLLFGKGDLDQTAIIACRCGLDSDCNPSSAAGVLFTTVGYAKLPEKFTKELDRNTLFSYTAYNFPGLIDVCEKLARQIVVRTGGKIAVENGEEVFLIPMQEPRPGKFEDSGKPGPIADSRFTAEELAKIKFVGFNRQIENFAPGWQVRDCGKEMNPGLRAEFGGKKNVFVTHPQKKKIGCTLSKTIEVPNGAKTTLHLVVGHDPQGDFDLIVRADGKELLRKPVDAKTAPDLWLTEDIDLSGYAGKSVKVELVNQPSGWQYEAAYWAEIAVKSK